MTMSPDADVLSGVMPFLLNQSFTALAVSGLGATSCSTSGKRQDTSKCYGEPTYLGFREVVTVVLTVRVADVQESSLQTSNVALGHGNGQTEHAGRNEVGSAARLEPEWYRVLLVPNNERRVRTHAWWDEAPQITVDLGVCAGPAQRERKKSRKNEQPCCDHVE